MSVREEVLADGVRLICGESEEVLPTLNTVDLLLTDPAYGINAARTRNSQKNGWRDYAAPGWDQERTSPDLIRAALAKAKHAIIWGGNYWSDILPPTDKWLSWDKGQTDFSLADFELAWCSFHGAARRLTYARALAMQDGKEHPTQKPVALMRWCLEKAPKPCRSVLDPFLGSGTSGIAAVQHGCAFIGVEREPAYFDIACRRIEDALRRPDLFVERPAPATQEALF